MSDAVSPRCSLMRTALSELREEPERVASHVMTNCVRCPMKCDWVRASYPLAYKATPPIPDAPRCRDDR